MKTIFTSLLAIATTIGTYANPTENHSCPVNCPEKNFGTQVTRVAAVAGFEEVASLIISGKDESIFTKKIQLEDSSDDLKGYLNFQQTMTGALNLVETEKHLNAIEDLNSHSSFAKLMTGIFLTIESERLAEATENLQAIENFNNLMQSALIKASGI